MFENKCRDFFIFFYFLFFTENARWISPFIVIFFIFLLKQQLLFCCFIIFFCITSLKNKILIYIFLKHKQVIELIRNWVILQIGVGQDDKLTKKFFVFFLFFLRLKRVNNGYLIKKMARKAQTDQRWPFHRLLGL